MNWHNTNRDPHSPPPLARGAVESAWQQAGADPRYQVQPHAGASSNNLFIRNVFGWMTMGLLLTAASALFVAATPALHPWLFGGGYFMLMLATLGLVMGISWGIQRLSAGMAIGLFLLYSALNGAMLTPILYIYTGASVMLVFAITAATFGFMFVYGWVSKRDLTSLGSLAMMALFGLIIAMVVNAFVGSDMMSYVISALGVLIFVGLTAYDAQRLKHYNSYGWDGSSAQQKSSIIGALSLYLNFINLFLMLLRLLGDRR